MLLVNSPLTRLEDSAKLYGIAKALTYGRGSIPHVNPAWLDCPLKEALSFAAILLTIHGNILALGRTLKRLGKYAGSDILRVQSVGGERESSQVDH